MSILILSEDTEEYIENITKLTRENLKKIFQYIIVQIDKRFIEELKFYVSILLNMSLLFPKNHID